MVYLEVALIVLWLVAGAVVIAGEEVTKVQYICCWVILVMELVINLIERIVK